MLASASAGNHTDLFVTASTPRDRRTSQYCSDLLLSATSFFLDSSSTGVDRRLPVGQGRLGVPLDRRWCDAAGPVMSAQPIRPSRVWYWVAGAALVGSVVWPALGFVFWFRSMAGEIEQFQRVPIPGQAEVSFDRPGSYTVYFEGLGAGDETATIPAFRMSIAPVGGGEEVPIRPSGGSELYNMAGHSGRAIGTVRIEAPGRFLVQTTGEPQSVQANVAVGSGIGGEIARTTLLTVPGVLVLFFGGVVLAVVVAARRGRARRQLPAPATQAGTWAQGAAPAGWFTDPGGRHELRYWDGQQWTEHVSDRGTQAVDPR
jgi:hypothetical protein